MKNILLVVAFFLTFLITFDLFLKEPPVWPDEASLVQMTQLSQGNIIQDYRSYPSAYIPLLSAWFKVFGISIESQRIISLLAGFFCIIFFSLLISKLSKTLLKSNNFKVFPIILLITDFTFLQATRVGRPEIITLLFGLISIFLLVCFITGKYQKILYLIFSFITAAIAFSFHFNGIIYLISIISFSVLIFKKISKRNQKIMLFFYLLLMLGIISIILIAAPTLATLLKRFSIANAQNTWLITVFTTKPLELKLLYISFLILTISFIQHVIHKKQMHSLVIAFPLILSWIILIINKDFWYAIYIIPFVYLVVFLLLEYFYKKYQEVDSSQNKFKLRSIIFICMIIFLSNLIFHIKILAQEGGDKYSYPNYIGGIKQTIPDGFSVYTSSIPDPYYAFVNRKNNRLTRFPQGFAEKEAYLKELDETDYIIYNGPYGNNYYGNIVADYIKINIKKVTQIGGPDQYEALIVELKPRNERVSPK